MLLEFDPEWPWTESPRHSGFKFRMDLHPPWLHEKNRNWPTPVSTENNWKSMTPYQTEKWKQEKLVGFPNSHRKYWRLTEWFTKLRKPHENLARKLNTFSQGRRQQEAKVFHKPIDSSQTLQQNTTPNYDDNNTTASVESETLNVDDVKVQLIFTFLQFAKPMSLWETSRWWTLSWFM